jgi:hypothetical protein
MSTLIKRVFCIVFALSIFLSVPSVLLARDYCPLKDSICHDVEDAYYNGCRASGGAILSCLNDASVEYYRCMSGPGCTPYGD